MNRKRDDNDFPPRAHANDPAGAIEQAGKNDTCGSRDKGQEEITKAKVLAASSDLNLEISNCDALVVGKNEITITQDVVKLLIKRGAKN